MSIADEICMEMVKTLLPDHYKVEEGGIDGSIHCTSPIGIKKPPYINGAGILVDNTEEDEAEWADILRGLLLIYGNRLEDVFRDANLQNFAIYIRP
jgi:hypothetical protein